MKHYIVFKFRDFKNAHKFYEIYKSIKKIHFRWKRITIEFEDNNHKAQLYNGGKKWKKKTKKLKYLRLKRE